MSIYSSTTLRSLESWSTRRARLSAQRARIAGRRYIYSCTHDRRHGVGRHHSAPAGGMDMRYGTPRRALAGASPQGWTSNWVPAAPGSLNALADRLHTERQSARAREREPQTARQNERDRETEREREKETGRETERQRATAKTCVRARARGRQRRGKGGREVRGATSEIRQD